MPAARISSSSPWHMIMVVYASGEEQSDERARTALAVLVDEMTLLSGGVKPMFRVSIIDGGREPELALAAKSDIEAMDCIADAWTKNEAPGPLSDLLDAAIDVLVDNPGRRQDFTPYVVVLAARSTVDRDAIAAAKRMKSMTVNAGQPRLVVFDFSDDQKASLRALASSPDLYVRLDRPEPVAAIFPIVGSAVVPGPSGAAEVDQLVARLANY